jgi:hypothetical protein
MAVSQEALIKKIEELTLVAGEGKPIDIHTLAQHFKCPFADILVLLYELEKWHIVKLNIQNENSRYVSRTGKREVTLL